METGLEQLRDFLSARHVCLSGHELALPRSSHELQGARLLADVLRAHHVPPRDLCATLGQAYVGQDVPAMIDQALQDRRLDDLVQQLDEAFELDIEPRTHMAP